MSKIVFSNNAYCYLQNMQDSSIIFSPVVENEGNYFQLWPGVRCRDKMQDLPMIYANKVEIPMINGLYFNDLHLLDYIGDRLLIMVEFNSKIEYDTFVSQYHLITSLELNQANISESFFAYKEEDVLKSNSRYRIIISFDHWWNKSPLGLSILTFLLRAISYPDYIEDSLDSIINNIHKAYSNDYENGDLDGAEDDYTYFFTNIKYNIYFIVSNLEKIYGDNPLTGIDDIRIKDSWKEKESLIENSYSCILKDSIIFKSKYLVDTECCINYTPSVQHSALGFYSTFIGVNELLDYKLTKKDFIKGCLGSLNIAPIWKLNLISLLIENELIDKNKFKNLFK